jgi:hypothetical protein
MGFLDVEKSISIEYYYQIAKGSAVYGFTDGPAGGPTKNLSNWDRLGNVD